LMEMTSCELCGRKDAKFRSEIEGTMMYVCEDCSRFGKNKGKANVRIIVEDRKKPVAKDPEYIFLQGYGQRVKNAREKMGLKQEELAKKINERESLLHQIESEHFKPGIELARKLEKSLHITIIEEIREPEELENARKDIRPIKRDGPLTLGDMMNLKRQK
jgi:putative transcription factor